MMQHEDDKFTISLPGYPSTPCVSMLPRQQILISCSSSHQLVGLVDLKRCISFVAAVKHLPAYFSTHVCCD